MQLVKPIYNNATARVFFLKHCCVRRNFFGVKKCGIAYDIAKKNWVVKPKISGSTRRKSKYGIITRTICVQFYYKKIASLVQHYNYGQWRTQWRRISNYATKPNSDPKTQPAINDYGPIDR